MATGGCKTGSVTPVFGSSLRIRAAERRQCRDGRRERAPCGGYCGLTAASTVPHSSGKKGAKKPKAGSFGACMAWWSAQQG